MTPPSLSRRFVGWLAPADLRESLLDDLDEAFARRASHGSAGGARWWYRRQAAAGCVSLLSLRLGRRSVGWSSSSFPEAQRMNDASFIASAWQDARYGWRAWRRQPLFTLIAILSLALGIGASTAMFSIVDGVLLRPLDLPSPGQVMLVGERAPDVPFSDKFRFIDNPAAFFAWRAQATEFSGLAAIQGSTFTLPAGGRPELVRGARVSTNFFDVLQVRPQTGRLFAPSDDTGSSDAIVITDRLWRTAFGADPAVIGRRIGVPGAEATVVGVLPANFRVGGSELGPMLAGYATDYFRPLHIATAERPVFSDFNYSVIGRLRPGVTAAAALAHLDAIQANLARSAPDKLRLAAELLPVRDYAVSAARQELWLLLAGVLAVLLIVCVNLGGLSITRVADQRRDWAIRAALGAAPGRLARQVLGESVAIALAGGLLGIGCAALTLKGLLALAPADVPRLDEVYADWRVFAFGLGLSLVAGLVTGLLPALRLRRADPQEFLKATATATTADRSSLRSRQSLIGVQAALSTVLLAVAGLLGVSFYRLISQPAGFNAEHAFSASVVLGAYPDDGVRDRLLRRLPAAVAALPGVSDAAFTSHLPLEGETWIDGIQVPGRVFPSGQQPTVNVRFVSGGYFAAIGIPLLAGRDFAERDRPSGPPPASRADEPPGVLILSAATAHLLFPGMPLRDVIGRELRLQGQPVHVLGVAADARASLSAPAPAVVYTPYWTQTPYRVSLVVRGATSLAAIAGPMRDAIWRVAPLAPIPKLRALTDLEATAVAPQRYQFTLLLVFASIALLLAAMGVYALVAHSVARRRKELALRLTLGARASDLWRLILGQALTPVACGVAAGVLGALAGGRLLEAMLFEVRPSSPIVLVPVAVAVLLAASAACFLSARRGVAAEPWSALRAE